MKKVYVVEAIRYGDRNRESYVVGVFDSRVRAEYAGKVESCWRGGKYTYEITEHDQDYVSYAKIANYDKENGNSSVIERNYDDGECSD